MGLFVEVVDRQRPSLLPVCLDYDVGTDNLVRVIDAFIDELDLTSLGFLCVQLAVNERLGYAPGMMVNLYVCRYLHQLASNRKLDREMGRNVDLMWLIGPHLRQSGLRNSPDFCMLSKLAFCLSLCRRYARILSWRIFEKSKRAN